MRLARWASRLSLAALVPAACWWVPRPAVVPLRTVWYRGAGPAKGDLLVFLPGRGDVPEDFAREGLLADLRAAGVSADVVAADAHLAYYRNETVLDRLQEDVMAPARAQGYAHVRMAGISLGGLGALDYARGHPGAVEEVFVLAPYLGPRELADEIGAAGGLAGWRATARGTTGTDGTFRDVWDWLARDGAGTAGGPPLWLGYGASDRFAYDHRLLASVLPGERVRVVPGGHDWRTWRVLWRDLLGRGALGATAAR